MDTPQRVGSATIVLEQLKAEKSAMVKNILMSKKSLRCVIVRLFPALFRTDILHPQVQTYGLQPADLRQILTKEI